MVREQDGRLIVSQILDVRLSECAAGQGDFLLVDPGKTVLAGGHIQFDDPPCGTWQINNLLYAQALSLVRDDMDFLSAEDKSWMLSKTIERVWP